MTDPMTVPIGETMKKLIQKTAYKLCSTEVKMLLDKLDEGGEKMSLMSLSKSIMPSHGYLHIVASGKFSFVERIVLAFKMDGIHKAATKFAIVETMFDGEQRAENRATKMSGNWAGGNGVLSATKMQNDALRILQDELDKDLHKAHIDQHIALQEKLFK